MEFGGHDADAILSAQFLRALGLLCKPVEPPAASTPRPPPTPARRAGHDGLKPGEVTRVAEPGHPATFKYDSVSVLSSTSSGPAATVQEMVRGAQFYSHLSDPHALDTHCGHAGGLRHTRLPPRPGAAARRVHASQGPSGSSLRQGARAQREAAPPPALPTPPMRGCGPAHLPLCPPSPAPASSVQVLSVSSNSQSVLRMPPEALLNKDLLSPLTGALCDDSIAVLRAALQASGLRGLRLPPFPPVRSVAATCARRRARSREALRPPPPTLPRRCRVTCRSATRWCSRSAALRRRTTSSRLSSTPPRKGNSCFPSISLSFKTRGPGAATRGAETAGLESLNPGP